MAQGGVAAGEAGERAPLRASRPASLWTARRPSLAPADVLAVLWRAVPLMLAVFLAILALGVLASMTLKKTYTADSSLLVRLGQEYVYNPRVGDAARGAVPEVDQVIQSETEILGSGALKEKVIADIGLKRFSPKLAADYDRADAQGKRAIMGQLIKSIGTGLKIVTAPDSTVVRLSYTSRDPELSAAVLNTLVDEYLNFRKTVLADRDAAVIGDQRAAFETRLRAVDDRFRKFLTDNGVSDFDTEKASLAQIYTSLLTETYAVQAQLSESEGRLGATAAAVANAPAEIGLYRDIDHTADDRLTQLKIDRQDLLSRYRPGTQPVRDADLRIAKLEAAKAAGQASGPGARRVGVNPIYQTLQTDKNQVQATAASLRARKAAVASELAQVSARRARLAAIEPEYLDLARQRDVLTANVRSFTQREQESQAAAAVAQKANDNVRVVERAYVPTKGTSLKRPVLILAVLFAGFSALCAGLLQLFLGRGYPSGAAAERELGMPMLASARYYPARA